MVKGISRQVIVVQPKDRRLFDQAIFILSDQAVKGEGITDRQLLQEAKKLIREPGGNKHRGSLRLSLMYISLGAVITGGIWLLTLFV